jgi:hypothetical protein
MKKGTEDASLRYSRVDVVQRSVFCLVLYLERSVRRYDIMMAYSGCGKASVSLYNRPVCQTLYDKNLVKDNSWKEIAGEFHTQDKELSRRTQHCRRMAG